MISHDNFEYLKSLENNIQDLEYMLNRLEEDNIYTNEYELTLHDNALTAINELLLYKIKKLESLLTED